MVKVRESNQARSKAAHIAVGVDCDGIKHVLGIWVQTSEGCEYGLIITWPLLGRVAVTL